MAEVLDIQNQCLEDSIEWFGEELANNLGHQALGLGGETGEFLNLVKKLERGTLDKTPESKLAMLMELADVLIYACNCATILGADLGKIYAEKRKINVGRFGSSPGTVDRIRGSMPKPSRNGE